MLGIKDEGTKISLESMRTDTKANLENIKVELEGVLDTIKDLEAALNGNGKEVDISVMTAALYTKITSGLYTSRGISDYLMAMPFKIGYKLNSVYGRNIDPLDLFIQHQH